LSGKIQCKKILKKKYARISLVNVRLKWEATIAVRNARKHLTKPTVIAVIPNAAPAHKLF
jgi:hypothetical protein